MSALDTQPLARLYEEHAQALFGYLLNLTRHEADARDLIQDVFVKLARQPALLERVQHVRPFLLRLAHNAAIDLLRRAATRQRHHEATETGQPQLFESSRDPDEASFRRDLEAGLGALPPDQRAVVYLKLWESQTFETIAETLDIPLNTAASRFRYGLDKLRRRLRPLYDEIR